MPGVRGGSSELTNIAVFTGLYGSYEELNEQPVAASSGTRFICFTDDPDLRSETWEVVLRPARFPWDVTRSARNVKIRAEGVWNDFEGSIWVDNRVVLKADPEELYSDWMDGDEDVALPYHSYRRTVGDEFAEVLRSGYDSFERIREQRACLADFAPSVLDERPLWTGLMARRHTAAGRDAMDLWMDLVLRHSRRDQLSVNLALGRSDALVRRVDVDNHESPWHRWIRVKKREGVLVPTKEPYSLLQHGGDMFRRRATVLRHRVSERRWERRSAGS